MREQSLLQHMQGSLTLQSLSWQRPMPSILAPTAADWQWLPARPNMGLLLESTVATQPHHGVVAAQLLHKALAGPLLPSQQQAVLSHMDADPQLVHTLQLTPQQLPALVENTPVLAFEVLARMQGSRRVAAFHRVLAQMPLSLHSMEVVNRLTASGHLAIGVVHVYISNCISSCDNIMDKFMQNRLVRLVCVFLQSLVRHRVVDTEGLLLEVQAFCVKFSRIREAAILFRILKQMEQDGGSSTSSSPVAGHAAAPLTSPSRAHVLG